MTKTIYADILFLINFIVNYLILFTTARISSAPIRRLRLFFGASVGAIYGVAVFFPGLSFLSAAASKIAVSVLIVFIAFGKRELSKNTLLFLVASLGFAGTVFAATLLGLGDFCEINNGICYLHVSAPVLIISSFIAYILLSAVFNRHASHSRHKISRVCVKNNVSEIVLSALHDTGNSLRDPATNAPVVISDYENICAIFPQDVRKILDEVSPSAYPLSLDKLASHGTFKLIPYKTVNTPFALMLAYLPDEISVDGHIIENALIAISSSPVSDGGAYTAII